MTENLKCPFCGAGLKNDLNIWNKPTDYLYCPNEKCSHFDQVIHKDIWHALIDSKKAQDALQDLRGKLCGLLFASANDIKVNWNKEIDDLETNIQTVIASITKQGEN